MNKTLLIIEGMDNTGKDTLIQGVIDTYKDLTYTILHFIGPSSKDSNISFIQQSTQFIDNLNKTINTPTDLVIWNRSHIGEYVYGQIYRNIENKRIKNLINLIDDLLVHTDMNIVYVQLLCSSNTLMIDNEDGKSLSNGVDNYKTYLKTLKRERELFKEVFNIVSDKFKKITIYVNNGDDFVDKNSILNKVIKKIEE